MGAFRVGDVVIVNFPNSDLTPSKVRPSLVVASLSGADCILCAITSQSPHPLAPHVVITDGDFETGTLNVNPSYIRISKLFTADSRMIRKSVGNIRSEVMARVLHGIRALFQ